MEKRSLLVFLLCAAFAVIQAGPSLAQGAGEEAYSQTNPPAVDVSLPLEEAVPEEAVQDGAGAPAAVPASKPGEDEWLAKVGDLMGKGEATALDSAVDPARQPAMDYRYYMKAFGVLCCVLGLIILLGYLVRKMGRRSAFLAVNNLGDVVDRVYLTRGAVLHYVRTGGRILVVGVTNTNVSLVAEFDDQAFDLPGAPAEKREPPPEEEQTAEDFLGHLQASTRQIAGPREREKDEDEMVSLRGDIQRLQRHLQEGSREEQG